MTASRNSAFYWNTGEPSIFATDSAFAKGSRSGRSMNQLQTEAMTRYTKRTGRSAGSIPGISAKGDKLIEQGNYERRSR